LAEVAVDHRRRVVVRHVVCVAGGRDLAHLEVEAYAVDRADTLVQNALSAAVGALAPEVAVRHRGAAEVEPHIGR